MSVQELKTTVAQLAPDELNAFTAWFEQFLCTTARGAAAGCDDATRPTVLDNAALRRLARQNSPPAEWYEGETERPF